jgi:hypothetical protein
MTDTEEIAQTAALRLWDRLSQTRANNGGTIHKTEWLVIVAGQFKAELSACRPKGRVKGARNALFDALAAGCGIRCQELTRGGSRAIAVALADILAVSPDLTEGEIASRIAKYRGKHPTWPLTAPAIAKNWASLGDGDPTRTAKLDIYQEPAEWRSACLRLWGDDVGERIHAKGWRLICVQYGPAILRDLQKFT